VRPQCAPTNAPETVSADLTASACALQSGVEMTARFRPAPMTVLERAFVLAEDAAVTQATLGSTAASKNAIPHVCTEYATLRVQAPVCVRPAGTDSSAIFRPVTIVCMGVATMARAAVRMTGRDLGATS